MKANYSSLMQSKYFTAAFNSAIFDGPLRIYFAQFHESQALKIYFMAQQKLAQELAVAKEHSKSNHANVLVMIYPTSESFYFSFEEVDGGKPVRIENWNSDIVIGINGPMEDEKLDSFIETLRQTLIQWAPQNIPVANAEI